MPFSIKYLYLRSAGSGPSGGKTLSNSAGSVKDIALNSSMVNGVMATVKGPTLVLFFCKLMVTLPGTASPSVRSALENPTVNPYPI